MKKTIEIPKGKEILGIAISGHTYVRLLDTNGSETFRFDSPGEHVTAVVTPGTYTIETDGKLGRTDLATNERSRRVEHAALKPPPSR